MQQRQELRKAGLKITLPRLKILEILENANNRHLSAEDIYRDLLDSGEELEADIIVTATGLDLLVLGIYVAALVVLLATDLDQKLLPDLITFPLMGYALVVLVLELNPVLAGKTQVLIADGDLAAVLAAVAAPALLAVTDRGRAAVLVYRIVYQ